MIPSKKSLLEFFKSTWDMLRTTVTFLVAILVFIATLVTILPDQRESITDIVYKESGLTEQAVIIDYEVVDMMYPDRGFDFCPGGFFTELTDKPENTQQFVRIEENHDVALRIRKNQLVHENVVIKNVYVKVEEIQPLETYNFIADTNCGAGMTEKLFYIGESDYTWSDGHLVPSKIMANIAPENEEKFDLIYLSDEESVDYLRIFLPAPRNTLMGFRIGLIYDTKDGESFVESKLLYIARTDDVDKWNNDVNESWEIKSPARQQIEMEKVRAKFQASLKERGYTE